MIADPVLHGWPERALCAYDMHIELARPRHDQCTILTCDMKRFAWTGLAQIGHDPVCTIDECPECVKGMPSRYSFLDGSSVSS